ncbi:MAG TPA: LysR family transcriptional regulator [Chryseosolibacter sp.]
MIEVKHLELVRAIAQTSNMTKASEILHLTQPSLSHQLKEIEQRLGTQLFLRINKSMVLTPSGKRMLEEGRDILARLSALEKSLLQRSEETRPLRLTTQCYTGYHWLPSLFKTFQAQSPNTEIDIVTEAMSRPIEFLLRAEIDIAVVNHFKPAKGIRFEKLFDDEQVVLVPAKHELAKKQRIQPADFAGQHYIMYKEDLSSDYFAEHVLIPKGVHVGKVTKMQLTEARVELVRAGMGITVLSRWLAKPFLRDSKTIKLLPITSKGFYRSWYAAMLNGQKNDPVISHFTSFLKQHHHQGLMATTLKNV